MTSRKERNNACSECSLFIKLPQLIVESLIDEGYVKVIEKC